MANHKNKRRAGPKSLRLVLPATSANLGPAFDAAALAMDLYITVDARLASSFSIAATGRDAEICRTAKNHLILTTYQEVLESTYKKVTPLALRIKNWIPIGKGCGSSAAARLAGIALADYFGRLRWSEARIIAEASRREHHSDNASACWMGGLTVAQMPDEDEDEDEVQMVSIRPKGKWPLLLAVPDQILSTEKARSVLPHRYRRADVVTNIQNSMLLLAAFTQGRPDLLSAALQDRIHQPYRAPLCPLLPCLQELTGKPGILGAALSGAGPSVILFLDPNGNSTRVQRSVAAHLRHSKLDAELLLTSIASRGAGRR